MLQRIIAATTLALLLGSAPHAQGATTGELIKREGLIGLIGCTEVPDCICKYACPDYCKKPLPCPCGPLPPNLTGGCGPRKWWGGFRAACGCGEAVACGEDVSCAKSSEH